MAEILWQVSRHPVPYDDAVARMEERVAAIRDRGARETVWLLEHPALYTAGTSARPEDLIDPRRLPVYRTGRGGRFTYHGPGQRVCYVMLDLKRRGATPRDHVRRLQAWIIDTIARFGVVGRPRADRIGVWVERGGGREDKIAAVGVRIRRWVTYHGVSLNVAPDLGHYAGIVPCGIVEHGVTSLADLGVSVTMAEVDAELKRTFPRAFGD